MPFCLEGQFVWRISIPRWICTGVPNLVPISPVVWQLPQTFEFVTPPPKTPWGIEGRIVFSLCPFPDESADFYQIWCQSVQPFDSFPKHLNLWPPKNPKCPWDIVGLIVFSLCQFPDESADMYQIWCQSVQAFDSFPRLLNLWPLPPPPMPPGVLTGDLDLAYAHSQTNPQIFTNFGANRSSRLTASPNIWICDPLKTRNAPGILWG